MTTSRSLRFALWILRRLGVDDEPLAGDLVEEYGARRSQVWLWRQVAGAVLARPEPGFRTGPLGLGEARAVETKTRTARSEPPRIDPGIGRRISVGRSLSGGPVPGVGGLTTLALVFHVAVVSPQFLWLPVAGLAAGSLLSVALVVRHRRQPYPTTSVQSLGLSASR